MLKLLHLALAFGLELVLFGTAAYWGFQQGRNTLSQWAWAGLCGVIAVVLWGIFAAPRSHYRLPFPSRVAFEVAMFTAGTVMLYATGHSRFAQVYTALFLISELVALLTTES